MKPILISIHRLCLTIQSKAACHHILNSVSLDICAGECLGLVGESGSGKTSLAHILAGLKPASSGEIIRSPLLYSKNSNKQNIQIIFQNVSDSLNPKMTVRNIILEPLIISKIYNKDQAHARFREIMDIIELPLSLASTYPKELSGGQKQRICIGRSLIAEPKLLICDEPLSSLDSVRQAHIMKVFRTIKEELNIAMLFISHDLTAVHSLADSVAVIYKGTIVETASKKQLFLNPQHPYTQNLLRMIPEFCYHIPESSFDFNSSTF